MLKKLSHAACAVFAALAIIFTTTLPASAEGFKRIRNSVGSYADLGNGIGFELNNAPSLRLGDASDYDNACNVSQVRQNLRDYYSMNGKDVVIYNSYQKLLERFEGYHNGERVGNGLSEPYIRVHIFDCGKKFRIKTISGAACVGLYPAEDDNSVFYCFPAHQN